MKLKNILFLGIGIVISVFLFMAGWYLAEMTDKNDVLTRIPTEAATEATANETTNTPTGTATEATEPENKPESITMAIYPYVSNVALFQKVLTEMWAEIEPDIQLQFVDWNCYLDPYPNNIEVITYDALFLAHLANSGYIQKLDVDSIDDTSGIISFAMEGARYHGDLYGMPFLVCSSYLIHYKDDEAMNQVQNFGDLYQELSIRTAQDPSAGLQIGYGEEAPYFYLDALIDYTGTYSTYEEGPLMTPPDATILNRLEEIRSVAVPTHQELANENFRVLFAEGEGSACYAYSEALYYMEDIIDKLTIRPISFFEGENIQLFYADVASLCTQVTDTVKKEYCMKLINLIASEKFQAQLCYGTGEVQYMLPAREQVYLTAKEQYPIYDVLHDLVTQGNNQIFRFGPYIFDYKNLAVVALR